MKKLKWGLLLAALAVFAATIALRDTHPTKESVQVRIPPAAQNQAAAKETEVAQPSPAGASQRASQVDNSAMFERLKEEKSAVEKTVAITPELKAIREACERDRAIAINPATFRPANAPDDWKSPEPTQIVEWNQFLPTGERFDVGNHQVEAFALTGLKTGTFDYKDALASQGYREVTPREYPEIADFLGNLPENQAKIRKLQLISSDSEGKGGAVLVFLTRETPH